LADVTVPDRTSGRRACMQHAGQRAPAGCPRWRMVHGGRTYSSVATAAWIQAFIWQGGVHIAGGRMRAKQLSRESRGMPQPEVQAGRKDA
jgi:hypothetical protein